MRHTIFGILAFFAAAQFCFAQDLAQQQKASQQKEIQALFAKKWVWMAEKNIPELEKLFHEQSKFIHMSGTWKKQRELEVIETGSIWYKKADVHDVAVEMFGDTAIVWSRITLAAVVRGNEVSNEFTVTEIYQQLDNQWKMLSFTFSNVRDTHVIEH